MGMGRLEISSLVLCALAGGGCGLIGYDAVALELRADAAAESGAADAATAAGDGDGDGDGDNTHPDMDAAITDAGGPVDMPQDAAVDAMVDAGCVGSGCYTAADSPEDGCVRHELDDHGYYYCAISVEFDDGRARCQAAGMQLAKVDGDAEYQWMKAIIDADNLRYWLGGNDIAEEGVWLWEDGTQFWLGEDNGTPTDALGGDCIDDCMFNGWDQDQPDAVGFAGASNADCLVYAPNWGAWHDVTCTGDSGYLCEEQPR